MQAGTLRNVVDVTVQFNTTAGQSVNAVIEEIYQITSANGSLNVSDDFCAAQQALSFLTRACCRGLTLMQGSFCSGQPSCLICQIIELTVKSLDLTFVIITNSYIQRSQSESTECLAEAPCPYLMLHSVKQPK